MTPALSAGKGIPTQDDGYHPRPQRHKAQAASTESKGKGDEKPIDCAHPPKRRHDAAIPAEQRKMTVRRGKRLER